VYSPYFSFMRTSTVVVSIACIPAPGRHLARDRDRDVTQHVVHELAESQFVPRVEVRVQQADGDARDLTFTQELQLVACLRLVERYEHLAVGGESLPDARRRYLGTSGRTRRRCCAATTDRSTPRTAARGDRDRGCRDGPWW